jgi:hypothetical protein
MRTQALVALLILLVATPAAWAQSIVTPFDTVPDFCAAPTIQSIASGRWSNPATWNPAHVPSAGDKVAIAPGTNVTFDTQQTAAIQCVGIHGRLTFDTTVNTKLWAGTILVYDGGAFQVGTSSQPIPAGTTAEIVIANQAINSSIDPDQYGTGLLAWGSVTMSGATKQPTFVRMAQEPLKGQTTLVLQTPVSGWSQGDRLVLPDTRHMQWNEITNWAPNTPQWEELTLQNVSADGLTLTLSAPLQFDHLGARDSTGALTFLPHVGNLTRNVMIRSESPSGTRGHVWFTYRAQIDVRYTTFRDLGRTTTAASSTTNHDDRYNLYMQHVMGTPTPAPGSYQYTLLGNAFDGGSAANTFRWGFAAVDSHYGLVQDNVGYNFAGAIFVLEDGSESYNVLDHNFAMRTSGTGDRLALGTEGTGFWFRGPNSRIRNNVAADLWGDSVESAYGFKYFMRYLGSINVPNYQGADTSVAGQYTTIDGNNTPLLEFSNNEVYGAAQGMTYWWVSAQDPAPSPNPQESLISNLHIWHVFNIGVYHYPAARVTIDGLVIRGKDPANSACCDRGWYAGDYVATNIIIRNSDIQGMGLGISASTFVNGTQSIESSTLRNVVDVEMDTMYSTNGGSILPPRKVILRNLLFAPWPGSTYTTIDMSWNPGSPPDYNTTQLDQLIVYGYQGNPNDNFEAYYSVQTTENVAGGRAPCSSTRSEIQGVVCPIPPESGGAPTPPAAPSNLVISQVGP